MGITISGANGIDMGDKPISNVSIVNSVDVVDKAYVDDLKIIATGTATFTATTNNINLTGIGIGVEVGDVIQISGAIDAKNNSEFTVEVITDDNNIIVNQAHANQGTSKNVATQVGDTDVTVKLLSKWYNADDSLGRGYISTNKTTLNTLYYNNTKRPIKIIVATSGIDSGRLRCYFEIDGNTCYHDVGISALSAQAHKISGTYTYSSSFRFANLGFVGTINTYELR